MNASADVGRSPARQALLPSLGPRDDLANAISLNTVNGGGHDAMSLAAVREGLRFVFGTPIIRSTMLIDVVATFFSSAIALLPIFAQSSAA